MLSPDVRFIPVTIRAGIESLQIQTENGSVLGRLDLRYSKMCRVLQEDPSIDLQAYVVPNVTKQPRNRRNKQQAKLTALSRTKSASLSVVLYGSMDVFEPIGEFLSQCSEYLQSPSCCDRNVPYVNPQSLFWRDGDPPMTFQLHSELSLSHIETMGQSEDPSAILETEDSLPETEAPAAIRTTLYRCVSEST